MTDPPPGSSLDVSLSLSPLGLGAWAFGRTGWGAQNDQDSRAAILRAVELGVGWLDTAAVYGDGHSEEIVGKTLSELSEPDRPLVFTKGGMRIDRSSGATLRDLQPASLRQECEGSLQRLGVERIDLYQLHWPVEDVGVVEQAWETLGELQDEGKVRWCGVSNFELPLLDRCAATRPIDATQVPMSLLSRCSGRCQLPWSAQHGVPAIVYSPLESGLLSGGFSPKHLASLPENDWRRKRPQFQRPRLDRTLDLLERLGPIAAAIDTSLAEMAIAWALAWAGVSAVIVGARTAGQVDGWVGASRLILDNPTLAAIEAALIETGAGEGPALPHRSA
jgi:aryl-alcohol dehydrogenase-like predicted oxidoreductase